MQRRGAAWATKDDRGLQLEMVIVEQRISMAKDGKEKANDSKNKANNSNGKEKDSNCKAKDSSMDGKGDLTKSMHLSFSHTHIYKYLYFS